MPKANAISSPEQQPQRVSTRSTACLEAYPGCGKLFTPRRTDMRHCSPKCRAAVHVKGRAAKLSEQNAKIRLLLRTAKGALDEAMQLMAED